MTFHRGYAGLFELLNAVGSGAIIPGSTIALSADQAGLMTSEALEALSALAQRHGCAVVRSPASVTGIVVYEPIHADGGGVHHVGAPSI